MSELPCGACGEIQCQWCQYEIDKAMGVRRRGELVTLGPDTFERDFIDDGDRPAWFVRCIECLATMDEPAEHQSRRDPAEPCRATARPESAPWES